MHFPFGPFRNAGDFRLWIVASVVWMATASAYAFYFNPPEFHTNQPASVIIAGHAFDVAALDCLGWVDQQKCVEDKERAADREDARQVPLRLAIIALPPFAIVGALWLIAGTVAWVRRGYTD
jgi:hypothetical protein